MRSHKREFSKVVTTCVLSLSLLLGVGFIVFVCCLMYRTGDLSPVTVLGPSIAAMVVMPAKYYMQRAQAKDKSDLEWEKTKRLTLFREKHPEAFTQGEIVLDDTTMTMEDGGNG